MELALRIVPTVANANRTRWIAKSDAFTVFAKMLDNGNPPEDWHALMAASADLTPG